MRLVVHTGQQAAYGQRLRIIEIGGKTADITASLLARLSPDRAELWFTDAHTEAVRHAEKRFGTYQSVHCELLDPDEDLEDQGIEPSTFDVVVCADALSANRNAAAALGRIRSLLRPGGLLLIAERRDDRFWPSLIFGLTDRSRDGGCPALDTVNLHTQIDRSGFAEVVDLSERIAGIEPGHSVIAARAPATKNVSITAKRTAPVGRMSGVWIVFADRGSVGTEVGRVLAQRAHLRFKSCMEIDLRNTMTGSRFVPRIAMTCSISCRPWRRRDNRWRVQSTSGASTLRPRRPLR